MLVSRRGGVAAVGSVGGQKEPSTFAPASVSWRSLVIADFIPDLGPIVIANGAPTPIYI